MHNTHIAIRVLRLVCDPIATQFFKLSPPDSHQNTKHAVHWASFKTIHNGPLKSAHLPYAAFHFSGQSVLFSFIRTSHPPISETLGGNKLLPSSTVATALLHSRRQTSAAATEAKYISEKSMHTNRAPSFRGQDLNGAMRTNTVWVWPYLISSGNWALVTRKLEMWWEWRRRMKPLISGYMMGSPTSDRAQCLTSNPSL